MGVTHGPLWTLEDEYSMQFDGTDDSITTGLDCASATHPDISISCWLKTSSAPGLTFPVGVECPYSQYISLGLLNGGGLYYKANGGWVYGGSVADGNWHNVIWTFSYDNPTSGDMTVKVYKDGNTTPVIDTVDNTYQLPALSGDLFIGSEDGTQYYFPGLVDEVGVWDRILTPTEVSAIYSNGRPKNLTPFNPLVWYRMGDNAVFKDPQWLLPENSNKDKNTNYSLEFDGTDDGINCGNDSSLQMTADVTVSAWIKTSLTSTQQQIIQRGADWVMNGFSLFVRSNDQVAIMLSNSGYPYAASSVTVTDGNWHHVVGVRDSSGGAGSLKIYVDGLDEGSVDGGTDAMANGEEVWIGSGTNGGSPFEGLIDDVSIFNSALSAGEVTAIWNNGVPSDLSGESNLVGYWKMGENATYKYPQWLLPNNENKDKESNYSLLFDGGDDYVDCGSFTPLNSATALTVSAWFKSSTYVTAGVLMSIDKHVDIYQGNATYSNTQGRFAYRLKGDYGNAFKTLGGTSASGVGNLCDGNWHHLCLVWDNATTTAIVYEDGVPVITDTSTTGTLNSATEKLYIGKSTFGGAAVIQGNVDSCSIFDAALSAGEVTAIYSSGVPSDLSGESNLVGYWKMGDLTYSAGTADIWVVPDSSINNNTGFADNMTLDTRVGDAPNSINNALSLNMEIFDRVGDAPSSSGNTLSYNMELNDRVNDTPG